MEDLEAGYNSIPLLSLSRSIMLEVSFKAY